MKEYPDNLIWTAVDIETTGINPYQYEILEIGAVQFSLKEIQDKFQVMIKTSKKQDPKSRQIHNISNEEVKEKGIPVKEALEKFLVFISEHPLVFHNASFDISFLVSEMKKNKIKLPGNRYYDNLYISRTYFPERESHALKNLCTKLGIQVKISHRALADAEATAKVFAHSLLEKYNLIHTKKKYNAFMRYHRRFDKFKILLPKNIQAIERYFNQYIQTKSLLHLKYRDKENKNREAKGLVKELMIFNQKPFLRINDLISKEEFIVPLKEAIIYDKEQGHLTIDKINHE